MEKLGLTNKTISLKPDILQYLENKAIEEDISISKVISNLINREMISEGINNENVLDNLFKKRDDIEKKIDEHINNVIIIQKRKNKEIEVEIKTKEHQKDAENHRLLIRTTEAINLLINCITIFKLKDKFLRITNRKELLYFVEVTLVESDKNSNYNLPFIYSNLSGVLENLEDIKQELNKDNIKPMEV